jgi:digeranylgeranylglycerophospholipid reductase
MLVAPDGGSVVAESVRTGYILDRPRFDFDLARRAQEAGAELVCEAIGRNLGRSGKRFAAVDIEYPGGGRETVEARIFIAADGIESQLARRAGIKNRLAMKDSLTALQYRLHGLRIDPHLIEFHFGQKVAPQGYLWVFPKSADSANVGICLAADRNNDNAAASRLDDFIADRFGGAEIAGRHCGLIPRYQGKHTMRKYNLLVVGDAARIIESLSGAGIALGMASGIFAGRAAAAYLGGRADNFAELDKLYPGEFLTAKKEELVRYVRMRRAFVHMTDGDFGCIVEAIKNYIDGNNNSGINVGKVLWTILTTHPRLLRLARYMI